MMNYDQRYYQQERQQQLFNDQETLSATRIEHPGHEIAANSHQYSHAAPISDGSVLAALFSYTFGWFSGLLFFLFAGQNRYVRFHALQSLLFFGAINLIDIVLISSGIMMSRLPIFPPAGFLLFLLVFFVVQAIAVVGWIMGMFQAVRGKYYQLPFVGNIALRLSTRSVVVK